jgi:hypothetical protein
LGYLPWRDNGAAVLFLQKIEPSIKRIAQLRGPRGIGSDDREIRLRQSPIYA